MSWFAALSAIIGLFSILIASNSHKAAARAADAAEAAAKEAIKSNQIILYVRLAPHFKKIDRLVNHIKDKNKGCDVKEEDMKSINESVSLIHDFFPKNKISATITELLKGLIVMESQDIQGIKLQKIGFNGTNLDQLIENINNFENTILSLDK